MFMFAGFRNTIFSGIEMAVETKHRNVVNYIEAQILTVKKIFK
jgi:hypothetical protein